jgi:Fe-S cluster assembly protein SufD
MNAPMQVRLGPAELKLIEQLTARGALAEAERLTAAGLPTRRVESYHFTDLKMLLRDVPELARGAVKAGASAVSVPGAYRLGIVNGEVQNPSGPAVAAPTGVRVGKVSGSGLTTRDDILVRLNQALAAESLDLNLEGEVGLVQIDRRLEGPASHSASSATIFVADGANATVFETYSSSDEAHVGNHASYFALGKGASLVHVTIDLSSPQATHFATNEYHLGEGARLRTLVVHAGAALSRTQLFPRFGGVGADADLTGLNLVSDGQHADITLDASHAVPHTSSRPLFKSIARGRSTAVVQGRLVVQRGAQKTDAKLMSQGLMLSDEASIYAKPELEIYADDVVCGHGSTCGRLDDEALFYLMSRGVPKAEAETMLTRAFLAALIDPIEDEGLNEALTGVIENWLLGP